MSRRELAAVEEADEREAHDEARAGDEPDVDGPVLRERADDEDVGRESGGREQHQGDTAAVMRGGIFGLRCWLWHEGNGCSETWTAAPRNERAARDAVAPKSKERPDRLPPDFELNRLRRRGFTAWLSGLVP